MPSNKYIQENRKKYITESAKSFKEKKVEFKHITDFAKAIAEQITLKEKIDYKSNPDNYKSEPKQMAHQTLLTNKVYRQMLEQSMENEKQLSNGDQAILISKDLEISNLKEQVKRLELTIGKLSSIGQNNLIKSKKDNDIEPYMSLYKVIKEFKDFIEIDESTGTLKNIVDFPATVILENNEFSGFLEFLKENSLT